MEGEEQIPEVHFSPVKKRAGEQRDGEQARARELTLEQKRRGEVLCRASGDHFSLSQVPCVGASASIIGIDQEDAWENRSTSGVTSIESCQ